MRSVSVVLPESMWAEMPMLRIFASSFMDVSRKKAGGHEPPRRIAHGGVTYNRFVQILLDFCEISSRKALHGPTATMTSPSGELPSRRVLCSEAVRLAGEAS